MIVVRQAACRMRSFLMNYERHTTPQYDPIEDSWVCELSRFFHRAIILPKALKAAIANLCNSDVIKMEELVEYVTHERFMAILHDNAMATRAAHTNWGCMTLVLTQFSRSQGFAVCDIQIRDNNDAFPISTPGWVKRVAKSHKRATGASLERSSQICSVSMLGPPQTLTFDQRLEEFKRGIRHLGLRSPKYELERVD